MSAESPVVSLSTGRKALRIAGSVLIYLVAVDVAAVLLLFLLDIVYSGFTSGGLSYAVWFVAGVFCSLFVYEHAGSGIVPEVNGDWGNHEDARGAGWRNVLTPAKKPLR